MASTDNPVRGTALGSFIAGMFGLVFVGVNSSSFEPNVRYGVVGGAIAAFVGILILAYRQREGRGEAGSSPFGLRFGLIVGVEVIALFVGVRLVTSLLYPEMGVAWVAFIVGLHFFALGLLFRLARFHVLALILTLLGITGLSLGFAERLSLIAPISGVGSGAVLLAFGLGALVNNLRLDEPR